MKPEERWRKQVVAQLRARYPKSVWTVIPRTHFGRSGVSDVLGCVRGWFIALEFKAPEGKHPVTSTQRAYLLNIDSAGGLAYIVKFEEDVEALIKEIDAHVP